MKILVLHNCPRDFRDWLQQALPGDEIGWATRATEVREQLETLHPECVLSIKHSEFPGEAHLPALQHPSVKWFHVGGSGTEHLGSWDQGRVQVTNSVGVLAPFHAERAMAGLLALSTGLPTLRAQQRGGVWKPTRFSTLSGKTILIVGLGLTGGELALRARAFGMKVLGVRPSVGSHPAADAVHHPDDLPQLWGRAHVLSLNLRHSAQTHHLVGAKELAALPKGCWLLNGARGGVIDQAALESSLLSGHLGGAWLDVTTPEPLPQNSVLWSLPNVILTPHCADQVEDFPLRFARLFVENLGRYRRGETLLNVVC